MGRTKKLAYNTITSLIYNIVVVICGFILPRYFLTHYGSSVNGLVSSITQFLGFISLTDMGVSAVVQSTLYKPLAENDNIELSKIMKSAGLFYKLIAKILLIYVIALVIVYPNIVAKEFDFIYTASLIIVLSISSFAQYYFGITRQFLLVSDQKAYIPFSINILTLIANTVISVILINYNYSIQFVKFVSALIFLIKPIVFVLYVKKHYNIDPDIELTEEPIKQKWNGMAQHVAAVVLGNTDITVLTLFSTLKNISIYSVYNMVIGGIKMLIMSLTSGIEPMIGNMIAKQEQKLLLEIFEMYEWIMHNIVTLLYTITAILVTDFVKVYTYSVKDTNYDLPVFAMLLTAAIASHNYRLPYNVVVLAAGHFKQTQNSAFIEAGINIILSIILVFNYGLIGVAIGTIVAMTYRTLYLVWYLSSNIINRPIKYFIQYLAIDSLIILTLYFATSSIQMDETTYICWLIKAIKTTLFGITISLLINILFKRNHLKSIISFMKNKTFQNTSN